MGTQASGPRASWKETPGLKERVIAFCAEKGSAAGNAAIARLILLKFHLMVTPGQVAGAVHRWGILRGHPQGPPIADPGASAERVEIRRQRHNDYRLMSEEEKEAKRLQRVAAAVERRKEYEANRERKARGARQVSPQRSIPSEPKVDAAAVARHDREMARPPLALKPAKVHPVSRVPIEPPSPAYGRVIECQTITNIGSCGIGIEQCGKPSKPGKPYCEDCCRVNYVLAPKSHRAHVEA